jgi:NADPH:quinone reductase-like Zn-dependent oxidoreductase
MTTLPDRMTVIAIRQPGGPEVLTPESRPLPQPDAGEILVKIAAAGVNRPDVMQRMGLYPPPQGATDIPGLEIAGEVVARGTRVTRWKDGDVVMALVVGGGYAEYCLAHESHALPVPENLSPIKAAAIPETFFTVWHNVFERGRLAAGETLLVHGGSSGIGTTAIQLARAFGAPSSRLPGRWKNAPRASPSAPMSPLTTRPKISSPPPKRRPPVTAPR